MKWYMNVGGVHAERNGKTYAKGEAFQSPDDLVAAFGDKFLEVNPPEAPRKQSKQALPEAPPPEDEESGDEDGPVDVSSDYPGVDVAELKVFRSVVRGKNVFTVTEASDIDTPLHPKPLTEKTLPGFLAKYVEAE